MEQRRAAVVLEDGTAFPGFAVGAPGLAAGEACFTTASSGYEEAATDPSYVAQVLCFAYPLVGNYGVDPDRHESDRVQAEAIVMRTARPEWAAWLEEQGVVAIAGVDTRGLVRRIRDEGVVRCAVGEGPVEELQGRALARPATGGEVAAPRPRAPADRRAAARPARRGDRAAVRRCRPTRCAARFRRQAIDRQPPRPDGRRGRGATG